jgi:glyoxylase-like metal-dependent hydrolase (beta-lactamase superfamily II)
MWTGLAVGLAVLASASRPGIVRAQTTAAPQALEVVKLHDDFYMIAGAGSNVGVNIGREGVVLVDAGSGQQADLVIAAVKRLTTLPIRYIINTNADADHVGGNEKIARAGQSLFGGPGGGGGPVFFLDPGAISNNGAASIVAAENVLNRMSAPTGQQAPYPVVAQPTETFTRKQKNLYLNNQAIQVIYQPAAHSDGDSIVMFRRSDVVATGDIVDMNRFPVIDIDKGGSVQGEIAALNRLIDLVVPSVPLPWKDGGTQFIPGHGRVGEQAELVEYRDMVTIVRDGVQSLIKKNMTLAQIQAANPTQGFRSRYGSETGAWTTDKFVEAIYRSLTDKRVAGGTAAQERP